jgi:hypothetical protein
MNYNYLIKIDKDLLNEQEEILKYIHEIIKQDDILCNIDDIKCFKSSELIDECRKNIKILGETKKQTEITIEKCDICENIYKMKEFIFTFKKCNHKYHKKCINKIFKQDKKTICPNCNDKYIENIIDII